MMRLVIAEGARFPELAEMYRRITLEPLAKLIRRLGKLAIARGELESKALSRFPLLLVTPAVMLRSGTDCTALTRFWSRESYSLLFST